MAVDVCIIFEYTYMYYRLCTCTVSCTYISVIFLHLLGSVCIMLLMSLLCTLVDTLFFIILFCIVTMLIRH